MYDLFDQRLRRLLDAANTDVLRGTRIGIEKECLRVSPSGNIAETPHPQALGSALTHPYITTDYSEALLEFITPPAESIDENLRFLWNVQRYVCERIDDEILWATSMPCVLAGEESIPIARYGSSNLGQMKYVYRRGLGDRYSRVMQVIAGIHFNYSLPLDFWRVFQDIEGDRRGLDAFTSSSYFGLIRNLQRFGWIVPYLFGASPAVCKSFFADQPDALEEFEEFDDSTVYLPYATSIRVSDIGYQNRKELKSGLNVSYNSLEEYIRCLTWAIREPNPDYERLGVVVDGQFRQLNANILQIENEYYSSVRPKQITTGNEMPSIALRERGVAYVELRSLDVSAFDPLGVNDGQLRFLEAFMLFCLNHESPPIDRAEREEIDYNLQETSCRGRDPNLMLRRRGKAQSLRSWASEICDHMQGIAEAIDAAKTEGKYRAALEHYQESVQDPERTPSARILNAMQDAEEGFFEFAMGTSQRHHTNILAEPLGEERERFLTNLARESIGKQEQIEASDDIPFDEFLRRYFAQT